MTDHFEHAYGPSEIVRDIVDRRLKNEGFKTMATIGKKAETKREALDFEDPGDIHLPTLNGKNLILEIKGRFYEESIFSSLEDHPYDLVIVDRVETYKRKRKDSEDPLLVITYCPEKNGMIWIPVKSKRKFWKELWLKSRHHGNKKELYYVCHKDHWSNFMPAEIGGLNAFLRWFNPLMYKAGEIPITLPDEFLELRREALRLYEIYKIEMKKRNYDV